MEDKQCKQRSDSQQWQKEVIIFLLLDHQSKQRYKLKTSNIQGYDSYQIKTGRTFTLCGVFVDD